MLSNAPSLLKPEDATGRSCDQCRQRKIRCNFLKPQCSTCDRRNKVCTYNDPIKKRGPKPKNNNEEEVSPTESEHSKNIPIPIKISLAENQPEDGYLSFNDNFSPSNISMFDTYMGMSHSSNSSLNLAFNNLSLSNSTSFNNFSQNNSPSFVPSDPLLFNPEPFDLNQLISPDQNTGMNWLESNQDTIRTHFHQSEFNQNQPLFSQEMFQSNTIPSDSFQSGIPSDSYQSAILSDSLQMDVNNHNNSTIQDILFPLDNTNNNNLNELFNNSGTSNLDDIFNMDADLYNMNVTNGNIYQQQGNKQETKQESVKSIPISHLTELETYLISLYYTNIHLALPIIPFEDLQNQLANIEQDPSLRFLIYCMCAVAASSCKINSLHDHMNTFFTLATQYAPLVTNRNLNNFINGANLLQFYFHIDV